MTIFQAHWERRALALASTIAPWRCISASSNSREEHRIRVMSLALAETKSKHSLLNNCFVPMSNCCSLAGMPVALAINCLSCKTCKGDRCQCAQRTAKRVQLERSFHVVACRAQPLLMVLLRSHRSGARLLSSGACCPCRCRGHEVL